MSDNRIHIYVDGVRQNTIGGIGFEQYQFNRLSDITLAPDGKLLALDSFQKKIKKFDRFGNLIAETGLDDFSDPTLIAVDSNGTIFVYDDDLEEITAIQDFGKRKLYSFGKFMLSEPRGINLIGETLSIYNQEVNKTTFFSKLGQFLEEEEGYAIDGGRSTFLLKDFFVEVVENRVKLALSQTKWNAFFLTGSHLVLQSDRLVRIVELQYEQN
jgi:hypothetical protein